MNKTSNVLLFATAGGILLTVWIPAWLAGFEICFNINMYGEALLETAVLSGVMVYGGWKAVKE